MPIFLMLFLIPLGAAAVVEYILCRFPKKRFWRCLPPAALAIAVLAVTLFRYHGWDDGGGGAPIETLLFFPGLPALGLAVGLFLGWRLWKKLWSPRVFREKKK
ncbi:hypothetical protein CE91St43_00050 [Oscillospiraceae bacterium]|nr:hypothetical protein CE91St43_00050 [Oscillospiraceae bacterium]